MTALRDLCRCAGEDWTTQAVDGEHTIVKTGRTCPMRDDCQRHAAIAQDKAAGRVPMVMADLYDWHANTCNYYMQAAS